MKIQWDEMRIADIFFAHNTGEIRAKTDSFGPVPGKRRETLADVFLRR